MDGCKARILNDEVEDIIKTGLQTEILGSSEASETLEHGDQLQAELLLGVALHLDRLREEEDLPQQLLQVKQGVERKVLMVLRFQFICNSGFSRIFQKSKISE